ncbi:MAG: aldo/keto reductase [Phycisphaeraceae bacterium]|nr:aldo/keto reductase [Phycisphaeraceae bacterium]
MSPSQNAPTSALAARLILGGHSFIAQLGNEPLADPDTQTALVQACLDQGLTTFDTTYQPERVALGKALAALGRRREARIIAWNFFVPFAPDTPAQALGGPAAYEPHHLDQMLAELQTDFIDHLVVHAVGHAAKDAGQLDLARSWQSAGRVGDLGTWHPEPDFSRQFAPPQTNPFAFMVRPCNVNTPNAPAAFAAAKQAGWHTFACSPFVRGWEMDKRLQLAQARQPAASSDALRARLADHMLRYSLFFPHVDRLIVAMRRPEWVAVNIQNAAAGPLDEAQTAWLLDLRV